MYNSITAFCGSWGFPFFVKTTKGKEFPHCAATVTPARDESGLQKADIPEQETMCRNSGACNSNLRLGGVFHFVQNKMMSRRVRRDIDQSMNLKRYIALGIAIVVLSAGSYFSEIQFLSSPRPAAAPSAKTADINFTLSSEGRSYRGTVQRDATIFDAMKVLASSSDFRFTSKDFPGMGVFIQSINGKQAANNYYWILYINGKSSDVGASLAIVRSGDRIEWRYEKSY